MDERDDAGFAEDGAPDAAIAWPAATIERVQMRLFDDPLGTPVRTSFGTMHSRPGLLVRLGDAEGEHGYGEVWCNFPEGGARYKATLLERYVRPALRGARFARPGEIARRLRSLFAVLRLQCADHGAITQLIAGVDQAAWDLFCKRLGRPFWRLLGGRRETAVYASGIGPDEVPAILAAQQAAGHTRFKLKLGFGDAVDERNLDTARAVLPAASELMVDVNQGWSVERARAWLPRLAAAQVLWCEEPVRADTPWPAWRALADAAPAVRLAAGENLLGLRQFEDAVHRGGVRVLQPDLGKWGGVSGNLALAHRSPRERVWLCPHWLAGGVGLAASMQFKAVAGGAGAVEVDANPNRQRSEVFATPWAVRDGTVTLPDTPGLVPPLADWLLDESAWAGAAQEAVA